ncbi:HupE/UreJ family protein [Shewanella sp. A25]|nr:HupE/UreJ family protein [Shewanella shenzhenensis]
MKHCCRFVVLLSLLLTILGFQALAHESQPGVVEIKQLDNLRYQVVWKAPIYYGKPHPASLVLPESWKLVAPVTQFATKDANITTKIVAIEAGQFNGATLSFPKLEQTITDVMIRTELKDGSQFTYLASPTKPSITLRGERSHAQTALEYTELGIHHILLGVDHLLFVLGLMLIVQSKLALFKTITSFTLAHSLTLGLATLGLAIMPLPPLNAAIALSILFLGPEIVRARRGQRSLTIDYPWLIAFGFGLLHGFGFASGLSTTGMPKSELPLALLSFNIGVELGQIGFVILALCLVAAFRVLQLQWPRWVTWLPGYTVGGLGAYWTIQRTLML